VRRGGKGCRRLLTVPRPAPWQKTGVFEPAKKSARLTISFGEGGKGGANSLGLDSEIAKKKDTGVNDKREIPPAETHDGAEERVSVEKGKWLPEAI